VVTKKQMPKSASASFELIAILVVAENTAVLLLVFFDTFSYEDKYLAVCTSAFIICNDVQFIEHTLVNSDR
jgi:hypothetical protein